MKKGMNFKEGCVNQEMSKALMKDQEFLLSARLGTRRILEDFAN